METINLQPLQVKRYESPVLMTVLCFPETVLNSSINSDIQEFELLNEQDW